MLTGRLSLEEFLIDERKRHAHASGDLNGLILATARACKLVSKQVAAGELAGVLGTAGGDNLQGEQQRRLDRLAEGIFVRLAQTGGRLAGMVSEESEEPILPRDGIERGKYLLLFDPLDGSSNIDVNVAVGSIFSVLRAPAVGTVPKSEDFLQPGVQQVCAGYAIYGPSTMLVLTVGRGTHGFTLDPLLGEFVLTHPCLQIPPHAQEFAINSSNLRFWEPAVRRYVDECLAGETGPRGKDFNMRWVASLVAETHRILMRGGVFLYPRDTRDPLRPGKLRLLHEANPIAFLIEQAGGAASTGHRRMLEVQPLSLHQRIGLVFGSRDEVERIVRYHDDTSHFDAPLFGSRGLFRDVV
jgi:fructose-1,6-bisphosphatase I / sedoheptulose-1,7-bisphosphatase